jgi:molybdenum cofactor biosynthesis enzyme MoaA
MNTQGNPKNSCMGFYKDTLDIKLTDVCNGNCSFCIEKGGKQSKAVSVDNFVNKINSINPNSVLLLGGEPFLYPHLEKFLKGISPRKIYITTNGSKLYDKDLLNKISPYLTAVNISLMHYSMDKHHEVTNIKLNINEIKEGTSILRKEGVSVRINSLLLPGYLDNTNDCNTMIEFAKYVGANDIRFSEVQDKPEMFVDAKTIFNGLNKNPYIDGCEQELDYKRIRVFIKQTCSCVNPKKEDNLYIKNISCHGSSNTESCHENKGCHYNLPNIDKCHGSKSYGSCNANIKQGVLYPDLTHLSTCASKDKKFNCHGGCH